MPSNKPLLKISLPLVEREEMQGWNKLRPACAHFSNETVSVTVFSSDAIFAALQEGDTVEFTVKRDNGKRKRTKGECLSGARD